MASFRTRHMDMPCAELRSEGSAQGRRRFGAPRFGEMVLGTFAETKVPRSQEGAKCDLGRDAVPSPPLPERGERRTEQGKKLMMKQIELDWIPAFAGMTE